jgi:probable rRNA maturation factor
MIYFQISENLNELEAETANKFRALLNDAAEQTLAHIRPGEDFELSIALSDDSQLHDLNLQFLGIDSPTDVLSFPAGELDPDTGTLYLGDVILSLPRAQAQATAGGYTAAAELQLLTVHGVLHLLGYDHAEPDDKAAMWATQSEILSLLGCPISAPSGE